MSNDESKAEKRTRGRPRKDVKADVVERLLETTEKLLHNCSHYDLSERQIAAAAKVHWTMIHYYFGSKDNLLFELIVRRTNEEMDKLKALEALAASPAGTITRQIFAILIDALYGRPWITKIMVSEVARPDSTIKEQYIKKYGSKGKGPIQIFRIVDRLVREGVYDKKVDPAKVSASMFFIVAAPLMLASVSGNLDEALAEYRQDDWIDHIADLFDRQLTARN